jgi:hypothetical protein
VREVCARTRGNPCFMVYVFFEQRSFALYLISYYANILNCRMLALTLAQTNPLAPLPACHQLNMRSSASVLTVQVRSRRPLVIVAKTSKL